MEIVERLAELAGDGQRLRPRQRAAAGKPVQLEIDSSKPKAARGPVDVEAAARDFGFRAKIGLREGIRRMIEAAG